MKLATMGGDVAATRTANTQWKDDIMKTKKTTRRDGNKSSLQAEYIGALFSLLDEAQGNEVPFRVDYDADGGESITISLGVNNPQVTRAAHAMGFTVTRHERIAENIYRGAEAYLVCEEPHAVYAIKAWMHHQCARADADGGMAVEYRLAAPGQKSAAH